MMDTFRYREGELIEEIESTQQKNNVLSNLLDLVTDRAESAQKELEKAAGKEGEERSPSVVSGISDVSSGSDDVFAAAAHSHKAEVIGEKVVIKDWQVRIAHARVVTPLRIKHRSLCSSCQRNPTPSVHILILRHECITVLAIPSHLFKSRTYSPVRKVSICA